MKIDILTIAQKITYDNKIIYCNDIFYIYKDGYYKEINHWELKLFIKKAINKHNKDCNFKDPIIYNQKNANEALHEIKTDTIFKIEDLNNTNLLNLNNCMLDIDKMSVKEHTPDYNSTIRINIDFEKGNKCPLWLSTLGEIFEKDKSKIDMLQEYFGLCLTKETKYEKLLFLSGEGANGKSVILSILEKLVGENRSAVPLEKFDTLNYVAKLHNKLINVSSETSAKTSVYDSMLKAIVSGDSIEADHKYGHPFTFNPFCKLVISSNNLPRVDDKSSAYYRRLIILQFNRIFKEEEQDKLLKHKLFEEINGIFIWALIGYKKLEERGYFKLSNEMLDVINQYKKDNNSIYQFYDEVLTKDINGYISVKNNFESYKEFCKDNGYKSLNKGNFNKELKRQFPFIETIKYQGAWQIKGIRKQLNGDDIEMVDSKQYGLDV